MDMTVAQLIEKLEEIRNQSGGDTPVSTYSPVHQSYQSITGVIVDQDGECQIIVA